MAVNKQSIQRPLSLVCFRTHNLLLEFPRESALFGGDDDWSFCRHLVEMKLLAVVLSLLVAGGVLAKYDRKDEAAYLADLPAIIADSYSSPLPSSLAATCVNKGKVQGVPSVVTLPRSMTSVEAQSFCSSNRYRFHCYLLMSYLLPHEDPRII